MKMNWWEKLNNKRSHIREMGEIIAFFYFLEFVMSTLDNLQVGLLSDIFCLLRILIFLKLAERLLLLPCSSFTKVWLPTTTSTTNPPLLHHQLFFSLLPLSLHKQPPLIDLNKVILILTIILLFLLLLFSLIFLPPPYRLLNDPILLLHKFPLINLPGLLIEGLFPWESVSLSYFFGVFFEEVEVFLVGVQVGLVVLGDVVEVVHGEDWHFGGLIGWEFVGWLVGFVGIELNGIDV